MRDFYIEILKNLQCTDAAAGAAPYPARASGMIPGMEGEPGGVFRGRSVTFIFRYALISEKLFSSELGRYRSFGIRAFQKTESDGERLLLSRMFPRTERPWSSWPGAAPRASWTPFTCWMWWRMRFEYRPFPCAEGCLRCAVLMQGNLDFQGRLQAHGGRPGQRRNLPEKTAPVACRRNEGNCPCGNRPLKGGRGEARGVPPRLVWRNKAD